MSDRYPTEAEAGEAFKRMDAEDAIAEPPESEPDEGEQNEVEQALLRRLFGTEPEAPEPIEGLAPKDKSPADYTPEERAAQDGSLERTLRATLEREERQRKEAKKRFQAEANRSDAQRVGDAITESLLPGAKRARAEAFVRSIHGADEDLVPSAPLPLECRSRPPGLYIEVPPPNPRLPDMLPGTGARVR